MTVNAFIRTLFFPAAFGCSLALSLSAQAAGQHEHHRDHGMHAASAVETEYHATGTVKRWNKTDVTITHDPVAALNWPVMTMSFSLPENGDLPAQPEGSKVAFSFRQTEEGYQLTQLSPVAQ